MYDVGRQIQNEFNQTGQQMDHYLQRDSENAYHHGIHDIASAYKHGLTDITVMAKQIKHEIERLLYQVVYIVCLCILFFLLTRPISNVISHRIINSQGNEQTKHHSN